MARVLPDVPLRALPPEHPIIRGQPGFDLQTVRYRPAVIRETPDLNELVLEAVVLEDRAVVVYSPYGFGCGVDGHRCYACRGLVEEDARKLAMNIVMYALTH